MKWKKMIPDGEKKTKTHFAWLPTEVGEWTVWLEAYGARYEAVRADDGKLFWKEVDRHVLISYPM